jgi:hypothetical protein
MMAASSAGSLGTAALAARAAIDTAKRAMQAEPLPLLVRHRVLIAILEDRP